MKRLLACLAALVLTIGAVAPAGAQLPLPGDSLIVTLTSPGQGATVSGTVAVAANVSIVGLLTVSRVEFFADDNLIGSDSGAPYSRSWDTTSVGNGWHSLSAVAVDVLGVRWSSNSVSVNVSNGPPPDTTRPTVTINLAATQADPTSSSPINFTVVFSEPVSGFTGGDVAISGSAGGTKSVSVSGGPSTYNAAVSGMSGSGTVIASIAAGVVQDGAGNTNTASTSNDNTVAFNLSDTTLPTVSVSSPADGATVSGTITVAASATDNVGVSRVEFLLDGSVAATDTTSPYSVPFDTTAVSNGAHMIAARAFDAAGNAATSATITVTVTNGGGGATRIEESAATFSAGWTERGAEIAAFSGGTAQSSDVAGATASFTFTGTGVSWTGLKCSICGIATVSIDGGAAIPVDTAGTAAVGTGAPSEIVFASPTLAAGTHTMVITVTGTTTSGGAHIVVDAFDVAGGSGSSVARIEQDNPAVSYSGTWVRDWPNPIASGGTFSDSNAAGATLTLSFTGREVRWLGYRCNECGIARVSVDGTFLGEVNTYSASPALAVVFAARELASGPHTLTLEVTGASDPAALDSWVIVDAFDVVTP